ncbi:MAG TPA: hypothetical protein VJN90_06595 [Candidatus Acidoferrales bacterium]|nr:hypothetical protein [Candidatus Acidoferrales bacterium]
MTKKQAALIQELDEISSLLRLDYRTIRNYKLSVRTLHLLRMKNHLIRGEVIMQYTLIDEYLSNRLCRYFFGKRSFISLWRTKKFRNFNYYVIEHLSLMEKLKFVKSITDIPRNIARDIERINGLRNGLAHAFFPQNLRNQKPIYKGKDIFTREGIGLFISDMTAISHFCQGSRWR